jgi:hypothetical protein
VDITINIELAWLAGAFNLGFALFHLAFWRLFDWHEDLASLRPVNRAIVPVMNLALTFLLAGAGIALWIEPTSTLLTAGMGLFWCFRALLQPLYFGLRHPLSLLMFALFMAGAVLHAAAWWVLTAV